jgi:hypothetical protein
MVSANFKLQILDEPSFAEFNRYIGVYKFGDPVTLFFKATESFVNCEMLHRKAERAKVLELPRGNNEYIEKMAMLHNTQGLRRLERARDAARKGLEMYPNIVKKEDELVSEKEMKDILSDYDLMIKDEILEMDLTSMEAQEIWNEYLTARKTVDQNGMSGLLNLFATKMDDLIEARRNLDKGREPASPLPWWKIVVVAAALVVSIGSVIYCYKKQDCKWVWAMVKAIGGATYETLKRGC